ncbi:hypothetical protein F5X96DRAFT_182541 [Biscogniauxia mediterranea]|nr:hypothetical protein F5X96DRAFT_182541 [Biscogniauxia mediterranea]
MQILVVFAWRLCWLCETWSGTGRIREIVDVAPKDLICTVKPYLTYPGFTVVACPNRDSTPYTEKYNTPVKPLPETLCGTRAYIPGFIRVLARICFLQRHGTRRFEAAYVVKGDES